MTRDNEALRGIVKTIDATFPDQPPAAVIVIESDDEALYPHCVARGTPTAIAAMVHALLSLALEVERPTECPACQHNYDLMWRALAVLDEETGRCA